MLAQVLIAEADAFVAQWKDLKLPDGRDRVVRHGQRVEALGPPRPLRRIDEVKRIFSSAATSARSRTLERRTSTGPTPVWMARCGPCAAAWSCVVSRTCVRRAERSPRFPHSSHREHLEAELFFRQTLPRCVCRCA
jgi:hypothetical protein